MFRSGGRVYHPVAPPEREDLPDLPPQIATLATHAEPRPAPAAIRVLIVDDHTLFAQTLSAALQYKGMHVVGIATGRAQAIEMAERRWPDVVLVDIGLRSCDGLSLARDLAAVTPDRKVIALTAAEYESSQRDAVEAGLRGFLLKDTSLEDLLLSIATVHDGHDAFPAAAPGTTHTTWSRDHARVLVGLLTVREQEILGLLAEALPTPRIAEHLNLSISTVRTHVQTVLGKLEVHSRLEAVAFARLHGIIDSD